jgi:hypothetical protein
MDTEVIDRTILKYSYTQLFGHLNDILDYIAVEHPKYIKNKYPSIRGKKLAKDFRRLLTTGKMSSHPFAYVRDIANTSKHLQITRPEKLIDDISQLHETLYLIRHQDDQGLYAYYKAGLIIQRKKGEYNHCEIIAFKAIKEIQRILVEIQLVDETDTGDLHFPDYYLSRHGASLKKKPTVLVRETCMKVVTTKAYVFDKKSPINIRSPRSDEPYKVSIPIEVEITRTPYKTYKGDLL